MHVFMCSYLRRGRHASSSVGAYPVPDIVDAELTVIDLAMLGSAFLRALIDTAHC
jgi:hypothetical protein